jgi:transposase-like protein
VIDPFFIILIGTDQRSSFQNRSDLKKEESIMFSIAFYFNSLKEYVDYIVHHGSMKFRPYRCLNCGKTCLHCHGYYFRKADRENHGELSLNPVPIPRFFCPSCRRTCSVLPQCVSPRRWYLWAVQQIALLLITLEYSWRYIATKVPPARSSIKRWDNRFKAMFSLHTLHLRSKFPELGINAGTFSKFWKACLEKMSLAEAMLWVHCAGELVP